MRLFVALWPSPDAVRELATLVDGMTRTTADLRWVSPHQWHLTLAFLGEVPEESRPDLDRRLERAASRHPPLRLRFTGSGRFGDRVLFTRVDGNRPGLGRLAGSATAAARRSGVPVDQRPYRPHLTLARSRVGSDLRPAVAALHDYRGVEWTAADLRLVHSRPGAGPGSPPTYETVATWLLTGPSR